MAINKEKEITKELTNLFKYIKTDLNNEYPKSVVTPEYFILATLLNKTCIAYKILNRIMLGESVNVMVDWYRRYLSDNSDALLLNTTPIDNAFDEFMAEAQIIAKECGCEAIGSGHLLCAIFKENNNITQSFKIVNVNYELIHRHLLNYYYKLRPHKATVDSNQKKITNLNNKSSNTVVERNDNNVEKYLDNINIIAADGKIDDFIGGENIYQRIFQTFLKRKRNNVVITGRSGIGKSSLVYHIANLITRQEVPSSFRNKVLVEMDFNKLFINTGIRGVLENKLNAILNDASKEGNYVFFIDDLSNAFNIISRSENDVSSVLEKILIDKNINFICTVSDKALASLIETYPFLHQNLCEIKMEEPNEEDTFDIIEGLKGRYERFHNVLFPKDIIKNCIKLSKEFITDKCLPSSVIDVMDEVGALYNMQDDTTIEIQECENRLYELELEKEEYKSSSNNDPLYFDKIDDYVKQEIQIKNELSSLKKKLNIEKSPKTITENDIRSEISKQTKIPVEKINETEKQRLKSLDTVLRQEVIGQDEAIDNVCKMIRRRRVGIGRTNKPTVFMFLGPTGTGKTFLAKKIAEKVFGDEKYLIRLDMSEYSDQTSTNKLIGSSAGYVGYQEGGILTNAIKNNKYCVLLLDEIEKAHNDVYNMFLQLFDDGRLTDNKGNKIDCKNLIVIMTSNVGAKESAERGRLIGFNEQQDFHTKLINKALKNKFTPEFLNRIDKIIHFNSLEEKELKKIILNELLKVKLLIEEIGHKVDDSFYSQDIVNYIYETVKDKKTFGARPIIRSIDDNVKDKITEILLNLDENQSYQFTSMDLK